MRLPRRRGTLPGNPQRLTAQPVLPQQFLGVLKADEVKRLERIREPVAASSECQPGTVVLG